MNTTMKTSTKILTLALSILTSTAGAQQDPMISQYMSNQLFFNPAYAGTHDYTTLSGLYRKQWVNFPGAPSTAFLSFDKIFYDRNIGLGFTLINDQIGVSNQTDIAVNYAYHIPVGRGHLSLGLKGQLSYYSARLTDLTIWDRDDQVFASNVLDKWVPNFGAGAYYYTGGFYAGLSVPHLLDYNRPSAFMEAKLSAVPNYERHYYVSSGYVIGLPSDIFVKPSILLKYVPNSPLEADLNVNMFFLNTFSVGASYRTYEGVVGLFEIRATQKIRIGYAFDCPFNNLYNYSSGTHEIMVSYDFIPDVIKMKTPRFF
jgi:type IX secretion system PorP/SprF family membrane protein